MAWMEAVGPAARIEQTEPLHVHYLTERNLDALKAILAPAPDRNIAHPYMARQILRSGRQGRTALDAFRRDGGRIRVITGMRDPVARSISLLFFFADFCGHTDHALSARDNATPVQVCEALSDLWRAVLSRRAPQGKFERLVWFMMSAYRTWFTEELQEVFGIDVYAAPFSAGTGAQRLAGRDAELLAYRAEDLLPGAPGQHACLTAAASFLNSPSVEFPEVNTAATRRSYPLYRQTRDRFRLSQALLDDIYDERSVRHFYGPDEIAAFKRRWSLLREPTEVP